MPANELILSELSEITNTWRILAIIWHLYFILLAVLFIIKKQLSTRFVRLYLILPLLSVASLAWANRNPFNGTIFMVLSFVFFSVTTGFQRRTIQFASKWKIVLGSVVFLLGFLYPHFLKTSSSWEYFFASPIGLIPCPTLFALNGIMIILNGLNSRSLAVVVGMLGILYGAVGTAYLEVTIDAVLIAGSIALILSTTNQSSTLQLKGADLKSAP